MTCPSCEIEMVPIGGRLTCPECGYDEPLWIRRNPLFDELKEGFDENEDEADKAIKKSA